MLTKQQLDDRRKGLGGSDAAAICGLSRYKSPLSVYLEKVEGFYNTDSNDAIHFGNVLEPVIGEEYARRTNTIISRRDHSLVSEVNKFMFANIDYFVETTNRVLECKTTSSFMKDEWGDQGSDFIPDEYLMQCVHYAHVLNVEFVDIAVLIGGQDFRIFTYKRNLGLESQLIEIESKFWNDHVISKIPPLPQTMEDIQKLWPESSENKKIIVNDEVNKLLMTYKENKELIKNLESRNDEIKISILSYMKDNELLIDSSGKKISSYKSQSRKSLDSSMIKNLYPHIYEECLKESNFRVFRT